MKTFSIVTTIAAAAASLVVFANPAAAQEATYEYPQPIVSSKSRADVQAELAQARAQGLLLASEAGEARLGVQPAERVFAQRRVMPSMLAAITPKAPRADVQREWVPTQFEPHSFDGSVTVADGAILRNVR